MSDVPKVYAAIAAIQGEMAKVGISKQHKNQQQNYLFRGIDDVYGALAPLLAKHGLVILPRARDRQVVERTTQKGTALFYVTVDVEFAFVCVEDGSEHIVETFGEAMDTADKATNKAMSAAYKYACFQAFCIPTEGDNDADATTHDVEGQEPPKTTTPAPPPPSSSSLTDAQRTAVEALLDKPLGFGKKHAERTWRSMADGIGGRNYLEWLAKQDGGHADTAKSVLAYFDEPPAEDEAPPPPAEFGTMADTNPIQPEQDAAITKLVKHKKLSDDALVDMTARLFGGLILVGDLTETQAAKLITELQK